jgi:hypothetical protein
MNNILDLSEAPDEPLHRLMWLSGVNDQVALELDEQFRAAYFELRLQNRLAEAFDLRLHSPTRVLAYTRRENESRGRLVRWNDTRR